jgi:hypothetical protein
MTPDPLSLLLFKPPYQKKGRKKGTDPYFDTRKKGEIGVCPLFSLFSEGKRSPPAAG